MAQDRPRIMVVDDDPGMRITLEGILEDEGFEVVGVEDGHRAIDLAKDTRFALILMDIKMPGINGVDAYKEIKKVSPESVVVMLTGYSVEGLVKEALAEGAYVVVYKPFAVEQLMDIVHTILDTSCVLVVDDRATDRETLGAILEESGYDVAEAQDGAQAISMTSQRRYGLVLMDIRMPGMDGFTAFEEMRRINPSLKVIFITGYSLEPPARQALLAGAYTVLTKPVAPDALLELMRSVVSQEDWR